MTVLYLVPKWFVGLDAALEIVFAIAALIVSLYSFKIYRISEQRELKLFGISFSLISLSYLVWSILNLFILDQLNDGIRGLSLQSLSSLNTIGIYVHFVFFTLGLITLAYTTLKTKNSRIYLLLAILGIMAIALSANKIMAFYMISSLILLFIVSHYIIECKPRKNIKSLMILLAFISILFSTIILIFATKSYLFYVLAHVLELLAYILILGSLWVSIKHAKKKKSS